jgi:hypothetical protein
MKKGYINLFLERSLTGEGWLVILHYPAEQVVIGKFKSHKKAKRCINKIHNALGKVEEKTTGYRKPLGEWK